MPITLELSPAITQFLAELVQTGAVTSESEYVGALIEQAWLDRQVALGLDQAERGEFVEFNAEDIIRRGRARLAGSQHGE